MIREYTVNLPMPRIMVQPEELPILTSGPFGGYQLIPFFLSIARAVRKEENQKIILVLSVYQPHEPEIGSLSFGVLS